MGEPSAEPQTTGESEAEVVAAPPTRVQTSIRAATVISVCATITTIVASIASVGSFIVPQAERWEERDRIRAATTDAFEALVSTETAVVTQARNAFAAGSPAEWFAYWTSMSLQVNGSVPRPSEDVAAADTGRVDPLSEGRYDVCFGEIGWLADRCLEFSHVETDDDGRVTAWQVDGLHLRLMLNSTQEAEGSGTPIQTRRLASITLGDEIISQVDIALAPNLGVDSIGLQDATFRPEGGDSTSVVEVGTLGETCTNAPTSLSRAEITMTCTRPTNDQWLDLCVARDERLEFNCNWVLAGSPEPS